MNPQRVTAKVDAFVEDFAATLVASGMPRMPSLVFAFLLTEDDGRTTADQLMQRLKISRGAVSGAVRYLDQVGLLRRERQPGSRGDRYALLGDSWYELTARREPLLDAWIASARTGIAALGPASPAGERLAESLAFFEYLRAELPAMLERWRAMRAGDP